MIIQGGKKGGGSSPGGSYLTTNGATTGATSQKQVFTSGIETGVIDDNGAGEILMQIGAVDKLTIHGNGLWSVSGAVGQPAYSFSADAGTGFYLKTATSELGASVNGVLVGGFKTTGLFATLTAYADNAAALGGGLVAGDFYRISSGGTSTVAVVQ